MPSSNRLSSSPLGYPEPDMPDEPTTPDANLRNRWHSSPVREATPPVREGGSPTSTTASTSSLPRVFDSRSTLHGIYSSTSFNGINASTPTRKLVIRSDPALATCFDPADKELYDLWAPKQ